MKKIENSKPFSSGTEYEIFRFQWCEKCKHYKINDRGFPAFAEDGGCPILDAMENARFDISLFPCNKIKKITYDDDSIMWHSCVDYEEVKQNER